MKNKSKTENNFTLKFNEILMKNKTKTKKIIFTKIQ